MIPSSRRDFVASAAAALGQDTFRSEANLVVVRFSVMRGREFVTDMEAGDFVVTEDRQPKTIAFFEKPSDSSAEKTLVDFHLLVDISGTMSPYARLTRGLIQKTLLRRRPGNVRVSIHGFAYRHRLLAGQTTDVDEMEKGVRALRDVNLGQARPNASAIFDAVIEVAKGIESQSMQFRPVLIVLSDGLDTSVHRMSEAAQLAREKGLTVYPVMVVPKVEWKFGDVMKDFGNLGAATGGRGFWPEAMTEETMSRIMQHVANQVTSEYTLGYYWQAAEGPRRNRMVVVALRKAERLELTGGLRSITN